MVGTTASTNADLVVLAAAGAEEGVVLVAEQQTAGRGRRGREWTSPARAGITVSVLVRPDAVPTRLWGWLPLLVGAEVASVLGEHALLDTRVKWPNDVLVGSRKVAGVLVERVETMPGTVTAGAPAVAGGAAAVVGIGLNVTTRPEELSGPQAASLRMLGAATLDRRTLLVAVLRAVEQRYRDWCAAGGDPQASGVRTAYLERSATVGRRVRVGLPGGEQLAGEAVTVDAEGRLVVRTASGVRSLAAGEVVHLRA